MGRTELLLFFHIIIHVFVSNLSFALKYYVLLIILSYMSYDMNQMHERLYYTYGLYRTIITTDTNAIVTRTDDRGFVFNFEFKY